MTDDEVRADLLAGKVCCWVCYGTRHKIASEVRKYRRKLHAMTPLPLQHAFHIATDSRRGEQYGEMWTCLKYGPSSVWVARWAWRKNRGQQK